jgi:hypothetical protein
LESTTSLAYNNYHQPGLGGPNILWKLRSENRSYVENLLLRLPFFEDNTRGLKNTDLAYYTFPISGIANLLENYYMNIVAFS